MLPRLATSSSVPRALFWLGVWPAVFERLLALLGRLSLLGSILVLLLSSQLILALARYFTVW